MKNYLKETGSNISIKAVVLAGGFGSRLKPLTDNCPKPMLKVANYPMIDYVVSHLSSVGIKDIVYTLSYMPEEIIKWASGYEKLSQHFVVESAPLGTCGAVNAVKRLLSDTFLVVSGDAIENIDFEKMLNFHISRRADVTMAITKTNNPSLYGVVEADERGFVTNFVEKPSGKELLKLKSPPMINCGVYIVNKSALDNLPNTFFDFSKDLFPILKRERRLACYYHDGYWKDLGDAASYYSANFDLKRNIFFSPAYNYNRIFCESNYFHANKSLCCCSAKVDGSCYNSILGYHSKVGKGVKIDSCLVADNAEVNESVSHCIVGNGYTIPILKSNQSAQMDTLNMQNGNFTQMFS